MRECVVWDSIGHLLSKEDLRESETDGVSEFIIVLVLPLCHSIHQFVVHILSVHNQVVVDMEDEVPRVSEGL